MGLLVGDEGCVVEGLGDQAVGIYAHHAGASPLDAVSSLPFFSSLPFTPSVPPSVCRIFCTSRCRHSVDVGVRGHTSHARLDVSWSVAPTTSQECEAVPRRARI